MSALDWLMQRLGGDQQASGTDPRDLAAAFDKMSGPAADQAYWNWQRERYGAAPPDRASGDPQVGPNLPRGLGEDVWEAAPLAPQYPQSQRDMPSAVHPPPGVGWPTIPRQMDRSLPRDFTFDDQPFRDTLYSRQRNPPSNPWDMLRVSPLNQMFPQYADPWAFPREAVPAALQARRRIPGLY